jgi:tRNA pseudouridine55 synthase
MTDAPNTRARGHDPLSQDNGGVMLLIDKPKDYSSAKVLNIIKRQLKIKKAGHSGTLDPKASGLLIICTGKRTKELSTFLNCDKEYRGVMIIGSVTRTFDSESEVNETVSVDHISNEMIKDTSEKLTGEIEQLPPMFSAVKYKGKPLYKYARKNREVARTTRKVTIKEFEIEKISKPEIFFRVLCSKGTYIRTLVNDFGKVLGTGAYLKELRRVRIGEYDVKDAVGIGDISVAVQ